MAITPLSEATTRVLGATVVLNDATTVIKELVDNALDSRATSVIIEISANTLDVIQLKDNGTGVGVEDRQLLCKRGCTSKIRTLDDLEKLGGSYLGFRGEALASITNLSESVAITTRVEGELVGSILKYGPHGKLLSSASASHPVGTTVRVQNFLTSIPVRKQTALKASNKTLLDIRQLLFTFAFARPTVRFSLKVLKGKNEKANWSYAPCNAVDELSVAATKIVGKEVAVLCKQFAVRSDDAITTGEQGSGYSISSLLLDAVSSDISKAGSIGQFFSLDNRPISAERVTIKEIAKLYKRYLQQASSNDTRIPSKPFICVHIGCPPGSYDVNIEPAKGEVMFYEPEVILKLAEKLFIQCYGELRDLQTSDKVSAHDVRSPINSSFNLLLARKPHLDTNCFEVPGDDAGRVVTKLINNRSSGRGVAAVTALSPSIDADGDDQNQLGQDSNRPRRNMYLADDDDMQQSRILRIARADETEDAALTGLDSLIRNPFTSAKMHTRLSPRKLEIGQAKDMPHQEGAVNSPLGINLLSDETRTLGQSVPYLPTPSKTPDKSDGHQNPGPPFKRRPPRAEEVAIISSDSELQSGPRKPLVQRNSLDKWMKSSSQSTPTRTIQSARDLFDDHGRFDTGTVTTDSGSTEKPSQKYVDLLSSESPNVTQSSRLQKPFRSPLKVYHQTGRQTMDQRETDPSNLIHDVLDTTRRASETNPDLEDVMDFEHRKKALNQRRGHLKSHPNPADLARIQRDVLRDELPVADAANNQGLVGQRINFVPSHDDFAAKFNAKDVSTSSSTFSPHQNRYLAATRNLMTRDLRDGVTIKTEADEGHEAQILATTMSPSDPRAILFSAKSVNSTISTSKPKRIPFSRLPFETISPDAVKPNTIAALHTPFPVTDRLQILTTTISKSDPYILTGKVNSTPTSAFPTSIDEWQSRLEHLVHTLYRTNNTNTSSDIIETQLRPKAKIPLSHIIKAHNEATLREKS